MTTRPLFAFCVLATLLAAGCTGQRRAPIGIGAEPSRDITIFVDNLDFNDARIYISTGGGRTRLGSVSGKTRERFTREWRLPTIGFEVDLLGGGVYRTQELAVTAGEAFDLLIQAGYVRLIPRGR
ncbi:MAG: hypothetical protein OXE73_13410 [Gammaproteobacteria bacterium]|nr:hypothetical protein [Gammaproteobacteria bacterium]